MFDRVLHMPLEHHGWRHFGVSIVNFKLMSQSELVSLLFILQISSILGS